MDWRILAAAMAVLMVLGGGTLLAGQVQADLDQGVDARTRSFERPDETPPLKLNDFKLPGDLPLEIPPGTTISPDLSKLTLPQDMDLQIPSDLDLEGLDFELPEDFQLELPEGTIFSPPGLELPEGATIRLPDGREFHLPAGSDVDLPPELIERLRQQGMTPGELGSARTIDINDLPPELTATLDPPQFDGSGRLRLPSGTTITLPDGRQFPFPAGVIPYAARYLLPAGTRIDLPFSAANGQQGDFPVPRPNTSSQLVSPDGTSRAAATTLVTEITGMPTRVRKGESITVSGYVRDPAGRPVPGAPVDIFMNETKRTPGVLVGQGSSDGTGTFVITLTLPADKPAREYQLVNHAVAFTDSSGRRWGDGWGDPPFATYASTVLKLDVPARDGLGATTPIWGTLVDNTGAFVSGQTISILVDGIVVARPLTNSQGRYATSHSFSAGAHAVEARFLQTPNYDGSSARANIAIDDFAIEIATTLRGQPGDTLLFAGRVLGMGAAAPERTVTIVFGDLKANVVSDSTGRFSYAYATPRNVPPGLYQAHYALPDHNVAKSQSVELTLSGSLALSAPPTWDVEQPIPIAVTLTRSDGGPIAGQSVRIAMSGPGGSSEATALTNDAGQVHLEMLPLRAMPGTYTISARIVNNPYMDAPLTSTSIALAQFEVLWSMPSTVIRGDDAGGAATIRFGGKPLAGAALDLAFLGSTPTTVITDANGRATWTAPVPANTPLGERPITISLADHPTRATVTKVVAVPKLAIDADDKFAIGEPVPVTLLLRDDQGAPLAEREITLTTIGPEGLTRTTVMTDDRGEWSGPLDLSSKEGAVTLSARFNASDPYLGAESVQSMSATSGATPIAARNWLIPAVIGLAAVAGGGAWLATSRFSRKSRALATAPVATILAPTRQPPDFGVRFAIPEGEPAVWGVGDPLPLEAHNDGAPGELELRWGAGSGSLAFAPGASARTLLTFAEEGDVTITATRADAPDMDAAQASMRIVDYRKETAREFDLFLEKAQRVDPGLTRRSTPREIGWTLEQRLGPQAQPLLDEIALVMEVTNYSHHEVSRPYYLRFVRAARALDPFFEPPAGG